MLSCEMIEEKSEQMLCGEREAVLGVALTMRRSTEGGT